MDHVPAAGRGRTYHGRGRARSAERNVLRSCFDRRLPARAAVIELDLRRVTCIDPACVGLLAYMRRPTGGRLRAIPAPRSRRPSIIARRSTDQNSMHRQLREPDPSEPRPPAGQATLWDPRDTGINPACAVHCAPGRDRGGRDG